MNFFRIIILSLILIFGTSQILFAADETTAVENENSDKDMDQDEEEDVPLNDPFAGNAATIREHELFNQLLQIKKNKEMN